MPLESLNHLFVEQLRDLSGAGNQLIKALPKMAAEEGLRAWKACRLKLKGMK